MTRIACAAVFALLFAAPAHRMSAQLLVAAAPVRVGHYHLNVTSVADHRKFWADTLGGTATRVGATEADARRNDSGADQRP